MLKLNAGSTEVILLTSNHNTNLIEAVYELAMMCFDKYTFEHIKLTKVQLDHGRIILNNLLAVQMLTNEFNTFVPGQIFGVNKTAPNTRTLFAIP